MLIGESRAHFFGAAAEAMRRILIERARRKQAAKRGARAAHLDLDPVDVAATTDDETLLAINDAPEKLALEDSPCAELMKLQFFVGLAGTAATGTWTGA